jgi:hypothetical protein
MGLAEIKDTSLWPAIANYFICDHCRVVDADIRLTERGYQCPICFKTSDSGRLFFDIGILTLIDLIQEAFHTKSWKKSEFGNKKISAQSLSVLIFFCSFREVLLDRLIVNLMYMYDLPQNVRDRLYADNRTYSERMTKLFPSLVGLKNWKEAIRQIKAKTGRDHTRIDGFLRKANDIRNEILHEGDKMAFRPHMKKACLENIPNVIALYVDFHNTFIHPAYLGRL